MRRVLIIEDNTNIRENVCEILEMEGYEVFSAVNGRSGIAIAKECQPHVILCDIMMPEANGYEVFSELKNDGATSHIPFVFLTASADKKEVEIGLNMGAAGYISKPFEEDALLEILERYITK